jgi:hypothetical protein
LGIQTINIMVRMPQYTRLEKDYSGQVRLLEVIDCLYGIHIEDSILRRAAQQIKDIDAEVNRSRKMKDVVTHLENYYDAQSVTRQKKETPTVIAGNRKLSERNGKPFQTGIAYSSGG